MDYKVEVFEPFQEPTIVPLENALPSKEAIVMESINNIHFNSYIVHPREDSEEAQATTASVLCGEVAQGSTAVRCESHGFGRYKSEVQSSDDKALNDNPGYPSPVVPRIRTGFTPHFAVKALKQGTPLNGQECRELVLGFKRITDGVLE